MSLDINWLFIPYTLHAVTYIASVGQNWCMPPPPISWPRKKDQVIPRFPSLHSEPSGPAFLKACICPSLCMVCISLWAGLWFSPAWQLQSCAATQGPWPTPRASLHSAQSGIDTVTYGTDDIRLTMLLQPNSHVMYTCLINVATRTPCLMCPLHQVSCGTCGTPYMVLKT